jgi:RNA polymerase sigma-70 factor (ECF subfamily)
MVSELVVSRPRTRNHRHRALKAVTVRGVECSDAVLAARLVAGDDDALAEAFDRYAGAVFAAAHAVLGRRSAAEDVVQDVLVTLWQRPERFDAARGSMRTFLTTLAHHRAVDVVRSELRRVGRERQSAQLLPSQRASYDDADAPIVADLVRDAVDQLPCEQRQVVELAYYKGLSYRDVATTAGIPEGTAKSRLRLALAKLEAVLDRDLLETS